MVYNTFKRGEVRLANTGRSTSALEAPSAADIGLTHKDIHEARIIRDAQFGQPVELTSNSSGIIGPTEDGVHESFR